MKELTEATRNNRDKGSLFVKLIANYLATDPQHSGLLSDISGTLASTEEIV